MLHWEYKQFYSKLRIMCDWKICFWRFCHCLSVSSWGIQHLLQMLISFILILFIDQHTHFAGKFILLVLIKKIARFLYLFLAVVILSVYWVWWHWYHSNCVLFEFDKVWWIGEFNSSLMFRRENTTIIILHWD